MTAASLAQAATPNIKPGLWEMKMENASGGPGMPNAAEMEKAMKQMQAQLANMPPEQRKMMEEHMGNAGMAFGNNGGMRVCLAKEDIERNNIPLNDDKNCKTTIKTQTAKRWAADVSCTQPPTMGQVEALFESDTTYLVKIKGQRSTEGKSTAYAMDMRYKYLGSDCGGLKPASQMKLPKAK
ncbi:MAG: DUF3617 domain-containing protein [Moraxellaceae bacterium]